MATGIGNAMFDAIFKDLDPKNIARKDEFCLFLRKDMYSDEEAREKELLDAYQKRLSKREMDKNSLVKSIVLYVVEEHKNGKVSGPESTLQKLGMELTKQPEIALDVIAELLANYPEKIDKDSAAQLRYVKCAKFCESVLLLLNIPNISMQIVHLADSIVTRKNLKRKECI